MNCRSSWWWHHVFYLLILQHTWVNSEEPSPTNETYWGNNTTGSYLVNISNEEISGTPSATLEPYWGNITTGSDLVNISSEETSRTPTTTLETYQSNITTRSEPVLVSNEQTSGTPNTTLQIVWSNITSGPDLVNISNEKISGTPNTTLETYPSNITTRPEPVLISSEQTTGTSNNSLEIYWGILTTGPDLVNITRTETSGTPNTTLDTFSGNITTGPEIVNITSKETFGSPYTTLETYWGNITTGPDLLYISTKEISRTSDTTLETYTSNVTSGPDLSYTREETSGTTNTALDSSSSTVTSGSQVTYISAVFCTQDSDCPPYTMCKEQEEVRTCQCRLGSYFHHEVGCVIARTFPVRILVSVLYWEDLPLNRSEHDNNGRVIGHMTTAQYHQGVLRLVLLFQNVLGHVPGYLSTSVTDVQLDEGHLTIVHSFSTLYPVTEVDVWTALTVSPLFCAEPRASCASPLTSDDYQGLSLCDFDMCDSSSSVCRSHEGLVTCECRSGYYKYSPTDRACRVCGSGFWWTENRCERCPIGFGGFNCEESYLLVVIVESCAGCVLLASLVTLLVFYFRRKEPQKPTFRDSIVQGVPTDQPSLRLPRAQFSWRREWEWNEPPGKVLNDINQEAANPDGSAIHMKTFGESARVSAPNSYHGHHNLSFISD